jgi:hypothetical protein
MSDTFTTNLNIDCPEVGASNTTWGAKQNAGFQKVDALFNSDGSGTSIGLQIGTGNTFWGRLGAFIRVIASAFYIQDGTDTTKVAQFDASLITTGTTRTLQIPDASGVIATQAWSNTNARPATGTISHGYYGASPPTGTVFLNATTIGDASSSATGRANADTQNLFNLLWSLNSALVVGGAGVSAAADWAAHKQLTLPDHRGRVCATLDNNGGAANAARLSSYIASTTRMAAGGAQAESVGVTVSGTLGVSVGVTVSGALGGSFSGTVNNNSVGGLAFGGGGVATQSGDPVSGGCSVSGSLGGGGSGSASGSLGGTVGVPTVQPTIMVDTVIYL